MSPAIPFLLYAPADSPGHGARRPPVSRSRTGAESFARLAPVNSPSRQAIIRQAFNHQTFAGLAGVAGVAGVDGFPLLMAKAILPTTARLAVPYAMGHRVNYDVPQPLESPRGYSGLGQDSGQPSALASIGKELVISAPQIAGGIATGSATAAGTAGSTWLGMSAAVAVPVIGAAVVGATLAISALFNRKGPKQKVATTEVVNLAEPEMQANLDGFLNGPRTVSSREQALNNFDALWFWVVDHCDIPEMGTPGQNCVNERQRGGSAPWCPNPGGTGCDWFTLYRDPIANSEVVPDPPLELSDLGSQPSTGSIIGDAKAILESKTVIGGLEIPVWGLAAGAVGLLLLLNAGSGGGR